MKRKSPKQLRQSERLEEEHLMNLDLIETIVSRGSKAERLPQPRYHDGKTHVARRRRRRNRDDQWKQFDQKMYEWILSENKRSIIKDGGWESHTIVKKDIDKWEIYGDNIS